MEKQHKITVTALAGWLLVCFCFAGIPAMILYFSWVKYLTMAEELKKEELKIELQYALREGSIIADIEKFWCGELTERFRSEGINGLPLADNHAWLMQKRKDYGACFEFIIWNPKGEIYSRSFSDNYTSEQWHLVFQELSAVCDNSADLAWQVGPRPDIEKIREVLGPQYVGEMIEANTHQKLYGFAWPDSSLHKPLLWTCFDNTGGYLLLFSPSKLFSGSSLKAILRAKSAGRNFRWGLFAPDSSEERLWPEGFVDDFPGIEANLLFCEENMAGFVEEKKYYAAISFLTPEFRIFAVSARDFTEKQKWLGAKLAAFILLLLLLPFYSYTFKTMVRKVPGVIKIRPRLAFLFFFANVVPFLGMSIIAREYYEQKRVSMLKDIHRRSIDLLQDYDKRLESTISRFEYNVQTFFDNWAAEMDKAILDRNRNDQIIAAMNQTHVDNFFVISSSSAEVGSFAGVNRVEESLSVKDEAHEKGKAKKQHGYKKSDLANSQIFNLIGKRIMNELNGVSKSNKDATKLELFAESILQKSFVEITHSFIKAMGGVSSWGFGKVQNLTLLKFMSIKGSEIVDFMAVVLWNSKTVQAHYLRHTIIPINRNTLGLKVLARLEISHEFIPRGYETDRALVNFVNQATDRPGEEIETVEIQGKGYMAICFRGRFLERYKLIGLFPLERLDRQIGRQKGDLMLLGVLSVLLGLLLAQILTRAFVKPLEQLQASALAIENRDFHHRYSEAGKDEFAEIGQIFNEVMVGLEELEVAKVVQESLFPLESIKVGRVKIFGRSISMAELGGDYFDYFAIDERACGILMGDVAGHGVGAALIMAMAKSGILSSKSSLKKPQQLLQQMHQLIYSSKTSRQKKVMTFQYLCLDSGSGLGNYANAGACSPILVENHGKSAREVSLAGAALGAFKKARFNEIEIQFKPGDAILFYTDGIIEARNRQGEEIGYERFCELARKSWSNDPATMYSAIYQAYLQHIGGQEAQDDLTMVVTIFSDEN